MRLHEIENIDEAPLDLFKRGAAAAKAFMQKPQGSTPAPAPTQSGTPKATQSRLKDGTKDSGYTYDAQTRTWTHPTKGKARGMLNRQLMNKYGANDSGEPLTPSVGQKISQKLGGPFAQGLDPKAGIAQKIGAKIGSALGRGVAALVRPKDTDGDGQPDTDQAAVPAAAPVAQQPAPLANFKFGDTRPGVGSSTDQALGKIIKQMRTFKPAQGAKPLPGHMISDIEDDLSKMRGNKDYAIRAGDAILKFAGKGYDVSALQQKWSQEAAIAKKQRIMQSKFNEELNILRKLAGI